MPATPWRPDAEVDLIVGTPRGGGQDRPARALIRVLEASRLIDVPARLTNIAGRGGSNAWDALRARVGDPHVLSISSAPLLTNRLLGVTNYDHAELTPIANLYTEYLAFVASADHVLQSGDDFLGRLQRDPGAMKIAIATALGTTNHIALGGIVGHLGGDPKRLELRVFESALLAVADVVEGHADVAVVSAASAMKEIDAGRVRAFAVSSPIRMSGCYADVPTWQEQGIPCTLGQWRGVIGAPGITPEQVTYWESALGMAVKDPAWLTELAQQHWTSTWKGSAGTRAFLDAERAFLGTMLRELGLLQ